jgi:hypothetical protein
VGICVGIRVSNVALLLVGISLHITAYHCYYISLLLHITATAYHCYCIPLLLHFTAYHCTSLLLHTTATAFHCISLHITAYHCFCIPLLLHFTAYHCISQLLVGISSDRPSESAKPKHSNAGLSILATNKPVRTERRCISVSCLASKQSPSEQSVAAPVCHV